MTCRYINPAQVIWSILEFPIYEEWPTIIKLDLYISNEQTVTFGPEANTAELRQRAEKSRSNLMGFFDYNRDHANGRHLLYHEFPAHYIYNKKKKA